jgi:hypothetical protein
MVDAAAKFIKALSVTGGGTNFTANDYVKNQVSLSFIPTDLNNQTKFARRLGVNVKLVTRLAIKKAEFDGIVANEKLEKALSVELDDDERLVNVIFLCGYISILICQCILIFV